MGPRWGRLLTEGVKFAAVGGVATLVALVIFNFLVHGFGTNEAWLSDHVYLSYILANTVGMVISYRGSRSWAFKHRQVVGVDGGRSAYVVINIVTMSLPIACLFVSRNLLGLDDPWSDNVAANVVGLSLGQMSRFYLFRRYVFLQYPPLLGPQRFMAPPTVPSRNGPVPPAAS